MPKYVCKSPFEYYLRDWTCPDGYSFKWSAEAKESGDLHCLTMQARGRCDIVLVARRLPDSQKWTIVHDPYDVAGLRWEPKTLYQGIWFPPSNKFGRMNIAKFGHEAVKRYLLDCGGLKLYYASKNWMRGTSPESDNGFVPS